MNRGNTPNYATKIPLYVSIPMCCVLSYVVGTSAVLDSNALKDFRHDLTLRLRRCLLQYNSYVNLVYNLLRKREICGYHAVGRELLTLSAFNHSLQKETLLSDDKSVLEDITSYDKLINFLSERYASFLNCGIFQIIVDKYDLDDGNEILQYPKKHLREFLESHEISNFKDINPWLNKPEHSSAELVLKLDIELTARLSKLTDIHEAIARALGLNFAALRIIDIKDGCIIVTFLISPKVAKLLFNEHTSLTEEQVEEFQAMSALWLKCNGYTFYFKKDKEKDKTFSTLPRYGSTWLFSWLITIILYSAVIVGRYSSQHVASKVKMVVFLQAMAIFAYKRFH